MAKLNVKTVNPTLKSEAERNGYSTDKGGIDAKGLTKLLAEKIGEIKSSRLENAGSQLELAFLDVLRAKRACGELMSKSNDVQQAFVIANFLKNPLDASLISACLVLVNFGVRNIPELESYVTNPSEYAEIIKRMKMLLEGRKNIAVAYKIGAIDKDAMKQGFDLLKTKVNDVQSVHHAQGIANLFILESLGLEFKGLQSSERMEKVLEYFDTCFSELHAGLKTFDKAYFAGLFGIRVEIKTETPVEVAPVEVAPVIEAKAETISEEKPKTTTRNKTPKAA